MFTFISQVFTTITLIIATLVNSIVPMLAASDVTDDLYYYDWSKEEIYTLDYDTVMQKDPDEDFRILALADVQLKSEDIFDIRFEVEQVIAELVDIAQPDLIVTVGDNAIGIFAYEWFISYLDSFGIPWAPVMGNHDGQSLPNESWAAYKMMKADNCLFEFGPEGMGHGNYTIQVAQGSKILHTLYFMDTHDSTDYWDGQQMHEDVYDGLWDNQIDWYKWNVNGLNTLTNSNVESTIFMHIPFHEFVDAYNAMDKDPTSFGVLGESVCHSGKNAGMFDVIKDLGSTKNVICGHDHVNNYSTVYEGVRLSYVTKTGNGSYYDENLCGGSLLTIDENGKTEFSHISLVD